MRARRARREDAAGSGRDGDRGGRDDAATADAAAAREDDDDDVGLFREWRRAMTAPREDQEAFGCARVALLATLPVPPRPPTPARPPPRVLPRDDAARRCLQPKKRLRDLTVIFQFRPSSSSSASSSSSSTRARDDARSPPSLSVHPFIHRVRLSSPQAMARAPDRAADRGRPRRVGPHLHTVRVRDGPLAAPVHAGHAQVRSIETFFTHRSVSTFDRVGPFQLTGELFLYGTTLLRLQQNFLTCFVVNVVALSLPLLRARAGIAPATRPALVRATYVVFACTMTGLIAHVGTTITRPVPIKYRYCFNAYVALFTQASETGDRPLPAPRASVSRGASLRSFASSIRASAVSCALGFDVRSTAAARD